MVKDELSVSELAPTMVTDLPIQGIVDHQIKRTVAIPPITAAGVTLNNATHDLRDVCLLERSRAAL